MKLFDADQFIYEPRLRTYKAVRSELGYLRHDLIDGLRLRGCVDRNGITEFSLIKMRTDSTVFKESDAPDPNRPLMVVLAKG